MQQFIFDFKYVDEHYITNILKVYKNSIRGRLGNSKIKLLKQV